MAINIKINVAKTSLNAVTIGPEATAGSILSRAKKSGERLLGTINDIIEIQKIMFGKKTVIFKSPDISKLTEVIIDHRTKIYVPFGTDIEEARNRYLFRNSLRRIK